MPDPSPRSQRSTSGPARGWREFRPPIWLAMVGLLLLILVSVPVGITLLGGAIGIGIQIQRRRRGRARAGPPGRRPGS